MQCPSCRQEVSGAFCNFCGTTLAAAPAGAGAASIPATQTAGGLSNNAAAAIAYITIIPSIIFLVIDPYRRIPLVRFHSIQNIALAVAWTAVWVALMILSAVLHFIPFIGFLILLLDFAVAIGFFAAWLIALIKASKGEFFRLPIIGNFAAKQANI